MSDELRENWISQHIDNMLNEAKPLGYVLDPVLRNLAKSSPSLRELVGRELDRLRSSDKFWVGEAWYPPEP